MPEVTITNLNSKTIHCAAKTERLLDVLLQHTDWMHACGGKGRCTTCAFSLVDGESALSPITDAEARFFKLGKLNKSDRLACQVFLTGNIAIRVPESNKLPHLNYSE